MARLPQKPQLGQPAIKQLYKTVCDIVDYLPSLVVNGDGKSTYVTKSAAGTTIHAAQNYSTTVSSTKYYAGDGIRLVSGNVFESALSGGTDIQIVNNVINYTGSGGGGGGGSTITYTGEYNKYGSGWIWVDQSGTSPRLISSNLRWLTQLYNYPLVASSNIIMPNSLTACNNTVDVSQVGEIYSTHYIQTRDILHDGAGTKVNLCWERNPFGSPTQEGTNGLVNGLQIDVTLSGGRFTDVNIHKHVYGAYDEGTGTRYDPPTDSRVDCLLSGDNQHIFISQQQPNANGSWGGIISTNIHGDGTTVTMDADGTLHAVGGGGGGGTVITNGVPWPNYANLTETGNMISLHTDYTAPSGGGWLRISVLGQTTKCCSVMIDGNHIGMYNSTTAYSNEGQTFIIPIPPTAHFEVEFYASQASAWFDGHGGDVHFSNLSTYVEKISELVEPASTYCRNAWVQVENSRSEIGQNGQYWYSQDNYKAYWDAASGWANNAIALSGKAYNWLREMPLLSPQYNEAQDYFEDISTYALSAITAAEETKDIYDNWQPYQ